MGNFRVSQQVGIGATVANLLAGSPFEFVGRDSKVAVAITDDAFSNLITTNITFGSELLLQNGVLAQETGPGVGPRIPDNVVVDDVAMAGDRIVVEVTNGSAGAVEVTALVRILPI